MEIEFTDRYGGNPPSWLRGCHGPCEAMGFYPDMRDEVSIDDVEFVECPDCHGTGRVSWFVTFVRIPRWIWKGICFVHDMGLNWEMKVPWMDKKQHFILCLKVAFLSDLGLWKPQ